MKLPNKSGSKSMIASELLIKQSTEYAGENETSSSFESTFF